MGYANHSVWIDRDSGFFDVQVDYTIPAYYDPETGEVFSDTSWTATYGVVGNPSGGTSGWGGESEAVTINLGFEPGEEVVNTRFTFSAQSQFSADSVYFELNILSAAYATGDKTVDATGGVDIVITGSGDDFIRGFEGNDTLDAGDGNDIVDGGDGADTINGGNGDDTLIGGAGDDYYTVGAIGDAIVEEADGGYDTVLASVSYSLAPFVEQLVLNGIAPLDGAGNSLDNRLHGNGYVNNLEGLDGNDLIYGYEGDDTLGGGAGNDLLDGGLGDDRMEGNGGDDIYIVDSIGDAVVEAAGDGVDTVRVAGLASYTLGAEVENLNLLWGADFRGTGNGLANTLIGGTGNDTLIGRGGDDSLQGGDGNDFLVGGAAADRLDGGAGSDWASYANASRGISLNLATGGTRGDAAGDSFIGIERVLGSAFDDLIIGDAAANLLVGGAGDDRIRGGAGRDVLVGGEGADELHDGAGDNTVGYIGSVGAVTVNLATQTVSGGDAEGDSIYGFDHAGGGGGDDFLTGNSAANHLFGGAGDDRIDGGYGDDTIEGGAGADLLFGDQGSNWLSYAGSSAGVTIDLATGLAAGGDAEGDSYQGFEQVLGSSYADTITGGPRDCTLSGGDGDDTIDGGDGNDTIEGGGGADLMDGGAGIDTLNYAGSPGWVSVSLRDGVGYGVDGYGDQFSNFENLIGSSIGDALYGDDLANGIDGGAGGDYIHGGGGDDLLTGGDGDDVFYFNADSGRDTILDFVAGNEFEDLIQLGLGFDFDTLSEVMAIATQSGPDTILTFTPDARLTLVGVNMGALLATDFYFE